ncbi:MAG: hypothetical protein AAFQ41_09705 [Cyanobacteria bacterium J06623_7]
MNTSWKCLTVAEFMARCNWLNLDVTSASAQTVSLSQSLVNWQILTIEEFFARENWSGKLTAVDAVNQSLIATNTFDITAPNDLFWQCFNWQGEQTQPSPQQVESVLADTKAALAAVEEFSLNDLSQLF